MYECCEENYLSRGHADALYVGLDDEGTPATLFVDSVNGDDATAARLARKRPYATLAAAYAAASAGDTIRLLKGVHNLAADLIITKALTILGEPGAIVTGSASAYGWDLQAGLTLRDLKFSAFKGILLGNLTTTIPLDVSACEFDSGYSGIYALDAVVPDIGMGFTRCSIRNCRFSNLTDAAVRLNVGRWDECLVDSCVVNTVQRRGIQVGGNADYTYEAVRKKVIVSRCVVDGVSDNITGGTVNGIIVYGLYSEISLNHVLNCTRTALEADCEGIYTKSAYSTISNNVVVDSGQGEASINIKGRPQNAYQTVAFAGFANADAFTLTYGAETTANITYDATSSTTFQTMADAIKAALEALTGIGAGNILVSVASYSNRIVSFEFVGTLAGTIALALSGTAVAPSAGTFTWTYPQQQHGYAVTCIGNVVRGTSAATFKSKGINIKNERVLVSGNRIEGTTFGVSTSAADDCRDATIIGNEISAIVRTAGATAGIQILSNADGMRIINNRIKGVTGGTLNHAGIKVSRLGDLVEIRGNSISGVVGGTSATCIRLNEDGDGTIQAAIVCENIFGSDTLYGIRIAGPVATLTCTNNTFLTTTTSKMILYSSVPTTLYLKNNTGLITESHGVNTISASSTTRNVNHGLNLPTGKAAAWMITLTMKGTTGTSGAPYISSVTDTQFTVTTPAQPGVTLNFEWSADAGKGAIT